MRRSLQRLALTAALLALVAAPAWAADGSHEHTAAGGMGMTHRMMVLALQLGVILFVAKLTSGLFEKMKLPGVLGEIAGGILIGQYLLGPFPLPSLPGGLFPLSGEFPVSPELYGFCSVAAIVLLFDTGLGTDVALFMRYSVAGCMVGIGGVLLSFVLGDLAAVWCSHLLFPEPLGFFSPQALFLGVMSTATSVGITARLLSEKSKIDSPEGVTILAGAVIDDVLGIILLAVTMGMVTASRATGSIDWGHIGVISAKAVSIWLVATVLGLAASHRISVLLKLFHARRTIAIMALGMSLILAGLFEEAGLAMIIGAYVMGLSLSRTDICHLVREKLEPIAAFLVPVFFVVMGMLVDVRLIVSPPVLTFGAVYTAIAVFAKVAGCAAPALACGFNMRGALRIGAGMLPRGEVALIVAGIGLAAGVVGKEVFGVGVLMTLATTVVAPPLLLALLRGHRPGVRRPAEAADGEPVRFTLPSQEAIDVLNARILDIFEDDGFFVHTLDRSAGIFQMRKHDSVVTLRHEGRDVLFDCSARDRTFVRTAVLEVVSDLRRLAAQLSRPIDRGVLAETSPQDTSPATSRLSLAAHIDPSVMDPNLPGESKEEIIHALINLAANSGLIHDTARAQEAVLARESSGSTGMQHGIALPHAKTDVVDQLVCAIGLKPQGVDFDSLDGEPSRIFVLVLSRQDVAGPHVRFLATISQVLDEACRASLLTCTTADEMCALLSGDGKPARRTVR
jgi:Kef-type K+ transport system membrane component KefB/mannitol/fructose-specific phosphotransferase system IIA component (Ntr-type)